MSNYSKITKRDIGEEAFFEDMPNGNRELFKRALADAVNSKIRKNEEKMKDMEIPSLSKSYKTRMNRLFRERVGGNFLPFPEEDNLYERV